MRNTELHIGTLDGLIQEGQEKLAKFEETVGQLDWEPERCVHLLNLMCDRLNSLIRERDELAARGRHSSH